MYAMYELRVSCLKSAQHCALKLWLSYSIQIEPLLTRCSSSLLYIFLYYCMLFAFYWTTDEYIYIYILYIYYIYYIYIIIIIIIIIIILYYI